MRERLLAVVGAVCLVALAVIARSALAGDDEAGGSGTSRPSGDLPVVACSPSLAPLCDALAEADAIAPDPPELTLADAAAPPDDVDAWLAWDPGPAVAGFTSATAADAVWPEVLGVGAAPLAVAGTAADVAAACDGADWACLADAGTSGTAISVGTPSSDEGLARIEPLAQALTGGDTDAIRSTVPDLVEAPATGQRPAADAIRSLVTAPGSVQLVVGPKALLEARARSNQGRQRGIEVVVPDGDATATAVLAARSAQVELAELCATMAGDEDVAAAAATLGLAIDCDAAPMDTTRAGFLFQVEEKA